MKGLLIISTLVACSLARPDIGLNIRNAYQYQPPATSYGTPTGSYLPSSGGNQQQTYQQSSSSSTFLNNGNNGYQSNGGNTGASTFNVQDYARFGNQGSTGGGSLDFGGNQHQSNSFQQQSTFQHQNTGGFQQAQTQVHKHVYFYDSPEDLPAPTLRISGGGGASQKNYKIIFIKAPAYQAPQVPQIPSSVQNEEKTLVYVLVKKPDDAQDIVLPTLAPSKPSKPEVFFIKYKTQKEAEQHVQTIQQGQHSGVSANAIDNDSTFINSITDTKENTGSIGGGHTGGLISNTNDYNTQIFGGNQGGNSGHSEGHFSEASHTSSQVTSSGGNHGQQFGPAGASGPY